MLCNRSKIIRHWVVPSVKWIILQISWFFQQSLSLVGATRLSTFKYNKDILQFNKFFSLHNGETLFVCKIDFLEKDLKSIGQLKHDVILVTGNGDNPIDNSFRDKIPTNVISWYAQNALLIHPKIIPIPLGIENFEMSQRKGHGRTYKRAGEKLRILSRVIDITPSKFIYSNFNLSTHAEHRLQLYDCINGISHIDVDEPLLTVTQFFDKILEYKMVLCPIGNGIDTHRVWEVLYAGRVPIVIKAGDYAIYELYSQLPIVILEDIHDLANFQLLETAYSRVQSTRYNSELLLFNYWKKRILG